MPVHLNSASHSAGESPILDAGLSWQSRLSRRSFIAVAAAACACRKQTNAPTPSDEQTWALISDTHIGEDLKASDRGSNMADNLRQVVDQVVDARPDHVLFNGDVARRRGEIGDYDAFTRLIDPMHRAGLPMHLALGNHDHREHFCNALSVSGDASCPHKSVSSMVAGGIRWLVLDSLSTGNGIQGSLGVAQLEWLKGQLDARPAATTVVCVHHNPDLPLIGLIDAKEFVDIVRPCRQVKLVMFGHTHEYRLWQMDGLHFLNLPAVGYRFRPGIALGWVLARTSINGMKLTLWSIDERHRDHGAVRELAWRSLA